MAEPLFNIFGDHFARQTTKSILRQPLTNIENLGKTVSSGPVKPNEPIKKIGELKKSFLSNTGKALQNTNNTPRQVFTPRAINVGLIYNDRDDDGVSMHELKFTKPKYNYDNYHTDALDYLPTFEPKLSPIKPPPTTPPPTRKAFDMEFDCSYEDDFFTDDFSCDSVPDFEIDIPDV
ncbi:uncharacterized protein LOC121736052 isoform X2 [Aricia agestis]|uniref:uncharacterized protein LOC121736052 isoform X2 n=1 Tax=Aricia agestis TaxID=91739 RepID=UPI001C208F38|nr:uncharacterized protein LOC121736052 isoform X2 [Aricia agestis]